MERTAEEYRQIMLSVFELAISEARNDLRNNSFSELKEENIWGYIQGLELAKKKLEISKFLTEEK